jgi:hypothetical protein
VASDNDDSYDSDDGFVVRTDEDDEDGNGEHFNSEEDDDLDCELEPSISEAMEANEDVDRTHYVSRGLSHNDAGSSECSLPQLTDIFFTTPEKAKASPTRRRLVRRSEANRPQGDSSSDSDAPIFSSSRPGRRATMDAACKRGTAGPGAKNSVQSTACKRRRYTLIDSDSDDEPVESPSTKRARKLSKRPAACMAQHEVVNLVSDDEPVKSKPRST